MPAKKHRHYKYKNLTLFFLSLIFAFFISRYEPFHLFLQGLGEWGYIGAFLAGMLFVSSFTVTTAAVILLVLAERLSTIEIGILAGLGGVLGDFLIFHFIRDNLVAEVTPLYNKFGGRHVTALFHSKYFSWTLPFVGALIIASPFPDELGVSLMGISKLKKYQFLGISFILNVLGIGLIIELSRFVKP